MALLKIGFDIGGVLSADPDRFRILIQALARAPDLVELYIITDMNVELARTLVSLNDIPVPPERVHSADWSLHQQDCKAELCERLGLDFLMDDQLSYLTAAGVIGLLMVPRRGKPYYHANWKQPAPR